VIHQITENKFSETPTQHLVINASYTVSNNVGDYNVRHRTFERVQANAFRIVKGLASRYAQFSGIDLTTFWSWVYSRCNKKLGTWIWCDDLCSHLVYLDILGELASGRMKYLSSVLSPKVAFVRVDTGQGRATILDRSNWWRCPLAEFTADKPLLLALEDRVKDLVRWVKRNDLGCLRVTSAGQSLAAYRHRLGPRREFVHTPISGKHKGQPILTRRLWPRRHANQEATDLERAAYFGGPTHCYYLGEVEEPIYVLDVRSIYPYVMQRFSYPSELLEIQYAPTNEEVTDRAKVECVIALAETGSHDDVLPYRKKGATYYVTGRGRFNLCGPELLRAIVSNGPTRIIRCCWYRQTDLFSQFVSEFYNARVQAEKENRPLEADLCKLILNALPAKFGQQSGEWHDDPDANPEQPWGYWHAPDTTDGKLRLHRGIATNVQKRLAQREAAHAFPAIPAYVCSHARVYMQELIGVARIGGQVWYSAVDSIHCDKGAYVALLDGGHVGSELGQLRLKGKFSTGLYHGVGDYVLDQQITRSGLPAGAVYLGGCQWSYRDTESAAEIIGHGPAQVILDREVKISLPHKYRFGKVGGDGWVEPFTQAEVDSAEGT
jgi:DNA polymerase type B, organellar and viral